MTDKNLAYKIKIIAEDEKAYDEITHFLEENSGLVTSDGKYDYYNFSENKIARTNQKDKTIELTDNIDRDIVDFIKNFNRIEKEKGDKS